MVKNIHGGTGHKRGARSSKYQVDTTIQYAKDLPNCNYGQIIKNNGSNFTVMINGKEDNAVLCGKMKKKVRVNKDDIVLVQYDPSFTGVASNRIIHRYSPDHVKQLRVAGEINFKEDSESNVYFDESFSDESDDDSNDEIFKSKTNQKTISKSSNVSNTSNAISTSASFTKPVIDTDDPELLAEAEAAAENKDSNDESSDDDSDKPNAAQIRKDRNEAKKYAHKSYGNKIVKDKKRNAERDKKLGSWIDRI